MGLWEHCKGLGPDLLLHDAHKLSHTSQARSDWNGAKHLYDIMKKRDGHRVRRCDDGGLARKGKERWDEGIHKMGVVSKDEIAALVMTAKDLDVSTAFYPKAKANLAYDIGQWSSNEPVDDERSRVPQHASVGVLHIAVNLTLAYVVMRECKVIVHRVRIVDCLKRLPSPQVSLPHKQAPLTKSSRNIAKERSRTKPNILNLFCEALRSSCNIRQ